MGELYLYLTLKKKKKPQQTKAAAASPYTLDALEINIKLKKSEDNPTTDHHLV